jgi:acetylglutamate kinase
VAVITLQTEEAEDPVIGQGIAVVKIGGSMMARLDDALADVAAAHRAGHAIVLVHGGGPAINAWLARLGVTPIFLGGRRVTDAATLDVARAILIGQINSEIVRSLVAEGVPATGLSGMDGGMIRARRAAPELGLVGLPDRVHLSLLIALLQAGFMPVIAPLCLGPDDECLNVNADDVATAIAATLGAGDLVFASDVPGVQDATGAIVPHLTEGQARDLLAEGIITGGMAPKVENCLMVLRHVPHVHILDGTIPGGIVQALAGRSPGTRFVRET